MLRTDIYASRFETDVDAVRAVVALCCSVVRRVHIKGIVGARLSAGFAADASAAVEIYNAVLAGKKRRNRTDLYARSVGAMVTPHYRKQPSSVWKSALFDVFYPSAVNTDRHLVLGFTGYGAGMAPDALSVVDYEAKIH